MEIFIPVWNFSLVYQVKISSRLNSKLHFKMTLQLHVKISILYTDLKFQFVLTNRRWNVNQTWKFQVFHIIDIFSNPGWKFDTENARISFFFLFFCFFFVAFLKKQDGILTSTFQMDRWQTYQSYKMQEFRSSMGFRNCNSNADIMV